MRVLTVPNWSFGRDRRLLQEFRDILEASGHTVYACDSYIDHNRTVTAFSGEVSAIVATVRDLAGAAFDSIDLNRHTGVHPRIGALDVCPFVPMRDEEGMPSEEDLRPFVEDLAEELASVYELPVYFYEKSERARKESELPSLRKGGFGGLFGRRLSPDFGPATMHERLGLAVIGVRDFHLVFHTNLRHDDGTQARRIARTIRHLRMEGDPRFPGVRSMAFVLGSTQQTQVHFVSTMPDLAAVDPIVEFVAYEAALYGATLAEAEVIGVIRPADLPRATRLVVQDRQVVQGTE